MTLRFYPGDITKGFAAGYVLGIVTGLFSGLAVWALYFGPLRGIP